MSVRSFAERALDDLPPALAARFQPEPAPPAPASTLEMCRAALAAPIGSPTLRALAGRAQKIALVMNDASRDEPRADMLASVREVVPWPRVTIFVASGTHRADASVVPEPFRDAPIVVHDASRAEDFVDLGVTTRNTRVRLSAELAGCDLVVMTGRMRPHYFAGFSGGLKSVFPGLGFIDDILANHLLKGGPTARLGEVDENVCRADMEEAAARLPSTLFLLNVVADIEATPVAACSGDPVQAHRALSEIARRSFTVRAPRSRVVVVADRPPVSSSLYQASKLLPPAAALLEDDGVVIMVADCRDGTGPLDRVNQGIYELGMKPKLPPRHRVLLVSELSADVVSRTYATPAADLRAAVEAALAPGERAVVLWRAGECITEPA